jgi:hypothetical protein
MPGTGPGMTVDDDRIQTKTAPEIFICVERKYRDVASRVPPFMFNLENLRGFRDPARACCWIDRA